MIKNGCGRRIESDVWRYFKFDTVANRSSCVIAKEDGEACGKSFKGKNPTNLKSHLQSQHAVEYDLCQKHDSSLKNEKRNVTATGVCSNPAPKENIKSAFKTATTTWPPGSAEAIVREEALAEYLVVTGQPSRTVDEPSFRKYSWTLDPKFEVPGLYFYFFLL